MEFELSSVDNATLVFAGTLVVACVLAAFVLLAGLVALVLLGVGKLCWTVAARILLALVRATTAGWDRAAGRIAAFGSGRDLQGHSPSTGTYPRVILKDG